MTQRETATPKRRIDLELPQTHANLIEYDFRPLGREHDEILLGRFHHRLGPETVAFRYGGTAPLDERIDSARLVERAFPDTQRELALLCIRRSDGEIMGVAHAFRDPSPSTRAELTVIIADEFQGMGIGGPFMSEMVRTVRATWSIGVLYAIVRPTNVRMRRMLKHCGFLEHSGRDERTLHYLLPR
jgi:RimJ/RimL family protein N-acetyltransferase